MTNSIARVINVTREELKSMNAYELAQLLEVEEIKDTLIVFNKDLSIADVIVDALIVALSKAIGEAACTEFCDDYLLTND